MTGRLAALAALLVLAACVPAGSLAAAPQSKGLTPQCGAVGIIFAVSLLADTHQKHPRGVQISKVRAGWPRVMTAARAAERGLARSTAPQRQLVDRFSSLVDRLEAAGEALQANDADRFWATITASLPDVRAVSALGKRAGLVCRTSDGRGSVTVGP
jgi:hypothetical protein